LKPGQDRKDIPVQPAPLTALDRRLIRLLQRDARISNQDLADQAALSASACWRRVKALEAAGVITGYIAEISAERAGLLFGAIVHVRLERHERAHVDDFIEAVSQRAEVLELFATTGEADYHMRVLCPDKESYNRFLDDFLFRLPGLAQVRTNLILKDIKSSAVLPL
jgi:Lrp/AsnC family leucine-responsive transcriptional regulator